MSLSKLFQRIIWHNNTTPAINEDNLNAMSKAIDDIDDRVILIGDDVVTVIPQIQAYLEQAQTIVEAVEELSQNPPYIGANGNWYVFDTTLEAYKDSGVDASITVDIADITMIAVGAQPYVTNTGTSTDPIFHLFLPQSPQGATGNGIANIAKTGTQGLVDTYTITMTDGTTYTFTVTNGQNGSGTGDMLQSDYDSDSTVKNSGGIVDYVEDGLSQKIDKSGVWVYKGNVTRTITTDGEKTYRQLIKQLADELIPYFGTLDADIHLEADLFYGDFVGSAKADPSNFYTRTSSSVSNAFSKITYSGTSLQITYISISTASDIYCYVKRTNIASDGTVTYTDLSDTVPPTGKSWSFRFKRFIY